MKWAQRRFGLIVFLAAGFTAGSALSATEMSVQVRRTPLRNSPTFLGRVVTEAEYADRVEVVERQEPWVRVRAGRHTGWVHTTALTRKRIVLQAGDREAPTTASSGELALAGKGFNSSVEAEFKDRNDAANYEWVDRMETWVVAPREQQAFLKQGKLEPEEGGAK